MEQLQDLSRYQKTTHTRDKLYDAYLHELYFLGRHRLTRKYALIRNGLWTLLAGLIGAIISVLWHNLL
jgi:hypothetical protein